MIEHIHGQFGLRDDLDTEKATDLMLTLAGPSVYRTLVVDYGWAHTDYIDWLARTLRETLLPARAAN